MKGEKVLRIQWSCIWFNLKGKLVEMSLDEPNLKIYVFFVDEDGDVRGVIGLAA